MTFSWSTPLCDMSMTFTQQRIVEAVARGYTIVNGILYGKRGPLKVGLAGSQRYPTFTTNWNGRVYGIPVHQFAAYCYFGQEAFKAKQIRHLNGNTLDFSRKNIALGTVSENQLDKPIATRTNAAKVARASQGVSSLNRKLTDDEVRLIRGFYKQFNGRKASNGSITKLATELGVSRQTISNAFKGIRYSHVLD